MRPPELICFLSTILTTLLLSAATGDAVELEAFITYTNETDVRAENIVHRLTIPPDTSYQQVVRIQPVNLSGYKIREHENAADRYLEFTVDVEPRSSTTSHIRFSIEKKELSFTAEDIEQVEVKGHLREFTGPSERIESEVQEIRAIARQIDEKKLSFGEKIETAYQFPDKVLKFRPQKPTSALTALRTGIGDCTEYSYLFVGISRKLGLPARVIAGFFFGKNKSFSRPNHHASEIYTDRFGWVPVFPNLGRSGKYRAQYGFGKNPQTFITLKRSRVWTWSNFYPRDLKGRTHNIKAKVSWKINLAEARS